MRLLPLFLVLFVLPTSQARTRAPKIELSNPVATRLELVLVKADELRQALVEKQSTATMAKLKDLDRALNDALRVPDPDRQNKQHLDRILSETKASLEKFIVSRGENKRTNLQNAFKQIVLIGQTYKVKEQYKFFFCNRDRSVWLQKESKPKNPINPESLLNCGTRVE